jgi:hypothetical protein
MDVYKKNIQALGKTHPHLVPFIENTVVDENKIKVSRINKDALEVSYRRDDGNTIIIGDEIDLAHLPSRAKELIEKEKLTKAFLILSFGLGSYPEKLLKIIGEKGSLIVYEAMPDLFKAVIRERDFTDLLSSKRLKLLLGEDMSNVNFVNLFHRDIAGGRFYTLNQSSFVAMKESAYKTFRNKVVEEKRVTDQRVATAVHRGAEWGNAFLANMPAIIKSPGVSNLKDLFTGRPAIIVSAGPSLEKNIHLLREAKGTAIIIAVDVVLSTLIPTGIIPDLVVTLEANPTQYLVFEDIPLLRSVPAVFAAEVTFENLTSLYPGPMFFTVFPNHPVHLWLKKYYEYKGFIEQFGGSVSHVAFGLAQFMGADPIVFVGQDLSFQEKVHAGDVTGLFYPSEYIDHNKKSNPIVKDIFGEDRFTLSQFLAYKTSFEKRIATSKTKVFNATEGGLPIEGAEIIRLKNFIDEYCNYPPIDVLSTLETIGELDTTCDFKGMTAHIHKNMSKLKQIRDNAGKIFDSVLRLRELRERNLLRNGEAAQLIRIIEKFEKKVEDPILALIAPYRYKMENYRRPDDIEDMNRDMIQDSLEYYGELINIINDFVMKVDKLTSFLDKELEINNLLVESSITAVEKYFQIGMMHRKAGMVREAVKELERAASEFSNISDPRLQQKHWPIVIQIYGALGELYVKQHRFYEAREVLEALSELVLQDKDNKQIQRNIVDRKMIIQLINACNEKIEAWEKKKAQSKSLLSKAEANYGSHLESGSFYYRVGNYGRSVREYLRAVEEIRALLPKKNIDNSTDASIVIRLLSSFYGLAQTYMAMRRQKEAISVIDSGCQEIEKLDRFDFPEILEEFSVLFADIYVCLDARDKALTFGKKMLTIFPNGTKMKITLQTIMAQGSTRLMTTQV